MFRIVVSDGLVKQIEERLGDVESPVELVMVDRAGRGAALEKADAVARADLSDEGLQHVLGAARNLRWIHSWSAGVETLPTDELRERRIVLTNAAGVYAIPIAEWVLTAMLMSVKQAHAMHDAQRERRWAADLQLAELLGKSVLILGLGGIGQAVAERVSAFGMHVWGTNRSGTPVEHVERVITGDSWREVLGEADFVVDTLPLTPATRELIGAAELRMCKPDAWLINVGRGATVDEPALLDALRRGIIGGAAIDAWVEEPLPPDHPAWSTPNLIVWPHHSGSSPANDGRALDLFMDNLKRFSRGDEMLNVVDLEAGY